VVQRGGVDNGRKRSPDRDRADPADDVARRPFRVGRVGECGCATTERRREPLQVQLARDWHDGEREAAVDGPDERLEEPFRHDTERCRGVEAVARALVPLATAARRHDVLVHGVRNTVASQELDRARSLAGHWLGS
jgi:hypothetical protein